MFHDRSNKRKGIYFIDLMINPLNSAEINSTKMINFKEEIENNKLIFQFSLIDINL